MIQNGTYNYFLNGESTGVVETFENKVLSDGSVLTTSVRNAKPYNTIIQVETTKKNDKFENCKIAYQKDELKIEADYRFQEHNFQVLRKMDNKIVQDETFHLPTDAIFFPLMRCFQGRIILQVAENRQSTTVIVPDIRATTKLQDLLKPTFDSRTATLIAQNDKLSIYSYLSTDYNDNSEFHLDENNLLVYYKFAQAADQIWHVKLEPTLNNPHSPS